MAINPGFAASAFYIEPLIRTAMAVVSSAFPPTSLNHHRCSLRVIVADQDVKAFGVGYRNMFHRRLVVRSRHNLR